MTAKCQINDVTNHPPPCSIPRCIPARLELNFLGKTSEYSAVLDMSDLTAVPLSLFASCLSQRFNAEISYSSNHYRLGDIHAFFLPDIHLDPKIREINTFIMRRILPQKGILLLEDLPISPQSKQISRHNIVTTTIDTQQLPKNVFVGKWDLAEKSQYFTLIAKHLLLCRLIGFAAQRVHEKMTAACQDSRQPFVIPPENLTELAEILGNEWNGLGQNEKEQFFESLSHKTSCDKESFKKTAEYFDAPPTLRTLIDRCRLLFEVSLFFYTRFLKCSWIERQECLIKRIQDCLKKNFPTIVLIAGRKHLWQKDATSIECNLYPYLKGAKTTFAIIGVAENEKDNERGPLSKQARTRADYYRESFPAAWESPLDFTQMFTDLNRQYNNLEIAASACRRLEDCTLLLPRFM